MSAQRLKGERTNGRANCWEVIHCGREVGGAKASTDETSSFLGKISYTHTLMAIVMSANSNLAAEGKLKRRIMVATHDATNGENEPTCTHVFVREQTRNASSQS